MLSISELILILIIILVLFGKGKIPYIGTELGKAVKGFKKGFSGGDEIDVTPIQGTKKHENVIPAQAGIQNADRGLDSHFRGNDGHLGGFSGEK